jgi:hypothetical protein
MNILRKVEIQLSTLTDSQEYLHFLSAFGKVIENRVVFTQSNAYMYPVISVVFVDVSNPTAVFITDHEQIRVAITNATNEFKKSPHTYSSIPLSDFLTRMENVSLGDMDHIGFDLPWFDGTHPDIVTLRKILPQHCAYHLWPKNEDWDFILPATEEEIGFQTELNHSIVRRPKFEIVSISKVSTPIIQFEFLVHKTFIELTELFPEAIAVKNPGNVWVYIKNATGVDICFVLNEYRNSDWSGYLKGNRTR